MKKSKLLLAFAAAAMLLTGCMVEEIAMDEALQVHTRTFMAQFEPQTRTSIEMDGATGKVLWEAGDAISILDGTSNVKVVLSEENILEGGAKAVFSADVASGATCYAVYPYSEDNAVKDGKPVTVKPSVKQDGTFGSGHISYAELDQDSSVFTFHNAVSVLKFTQTGKDVARIIFEANNGTKLFDSVSSVEVTTGAAGTYYFCLSDLSLPYGFTIHAIDSKGVTFAKTFYNYELELKAGSGLDLGCLDDHLMKIISIEEFLDLPSDDYGFYIITGTIVEVENDEYGDFYLDDGTDSVLIYGLLTPDGYECEQFQAAGLAVGDVVTVFGQRSTATGDVCMENATYVSHETASFDYLFNQSEYGVYGVFIQSPYLLYRPYADQLASGNKQFRFVDPDSATWFSVTGLPSKPVEGSKYSITIDQNYTKEITAISAQVTVGKIEDDPMTGASTSSKVWLYTDDGVGFIVRIATVNK